MAPVHMSTGDRNMLKSSTSRLFLPSRKRIFTDLVEAVVLTMLIYVLYELPPGPARTV